MPAIFLSLPREIRDQIYYEMLFTSNVSRVGARAENNFDTWFAGREHLPGYYRPLLHYHNANQLNTIDPGRIFNWEHETRIASAPPIFHVGGIVAAEARALYFRNHVLFEMKILEDAAQAIQRWAAGVRKEDLEVMQKVHIYVHVRHVFEGPLDDPLTKQLRDASVFSLDLVDPVFRIELRNGGDELAILSVMLFNSDIRQHIKDAVDVYFRQRARKSANGVFTGADLILATKAVVGEVASYLGKELSLTAQVDVKDVACVYDYDDMVEAKLASYGTVLRLRDRWTNVVVKYKRDHVFEDLPEDELEGGLVALKVD